MSEKTKEALKAPTNLTSIIPDFCTSDKSFLDCAVAYAEAGLRVLPVAPKGKNPILNGWTTKASSEVDQVQEWWEEKPHANIGLLGDDYIIIDIDNMTRLEKLENELGSLPATRIVRTGREGGGFHYYFKGDPRVVTNSIGVADCFDIRTKGGQALLPPSIHPSGNRYEWVSFIEEVAPLPEKWIQFILNHEKTTTKLELLRYFNGEKIHDGSRTVTLFKMACSLQSRGSSDDEIYQKIHLINSTQCTPPVDERIVDKQIQSAISRYDKGDPNKKSLMHFDPNHSGDASRVEYLYGDSVRFANGCFYIWDETRWKVDNLNSITPLIEEVNKQYKAEVMQAVEKVEEELKEFLTSTGMKKSTFLQNPPPTAIEFVKKWFHVKAHADYVKRMVGSESQIKATRNILSHRKGIAIELKEFDKHPNLINLSNGTYDLDRMEFREHKKEDMLTKCLDFEFDRKASCPIFDKFLDTTFESKKDIISYVDRLSGYFASGYTNEHYLGVFEGTGANGKSVLVGVYRDVLGEYFSDAPEGFYTSKRATSADTPAPSLTRLAGLHLQIGSETKEGEWLNASLIKSLSGGDVIRARTLHSKTYEVIKPTHKNVIVTNHLPQINGMDYALRRRIQLLKFNRVLGEHEQDSFLNQKLQQEKAGIFNRFLRGYLDWRKKKGLNPPDEVIKNTSDYMDEMDPLAQFIKDGCVEEAGAEYPKTEFKEALVLYLDDNNIKRKYGQKTLNELMLRKGFGEAKGSTREDRRLVWLGLRKKSLDECVPNVPNGKDENFILDTKNPVISRDSSDVYQMYGINHKKSILEKIFFSKKYNIKFYIRTLLKNSVHFGHVGKKARRIKGFWWKKRKTHFVHSVHSVHAEGNVLKKLIKSSTLYIDTETTGLDPHTDKLRLIQISDGVETMVIDLFQEQDLNLVKEILASDATKVFHNATFDLKMLEHNGFVVGGKIFDTMIASQLLSAGIRHGDDGKILGHSLKDVVKRYLNEDLPKDEQKSDWSQPTLFDAQLEYAKRDVEILARLKQVLGVEIQRAGLQRVFDLEMATVRATAEMEYNGIIFDPAVAVDAVGQATLDKDHLDTVLKQALTIDNLNSHVQLLPALNAVGIDVDATAVKTLQLYKTADSTQKNILDTILLRKKAVNILNNYNKIPKWINPATGRVHASIKQASTVTGRYATNKPNMQGIPRTAIFRQSFKPATGHKLIIADYSQIELRLVTTWTKDTVMMKAYNEGVDLHKLTASKLMGCPLDAVTKQDRQIAKAVNFGLLYGMGANTLQRYALESYGVELSLEEAQEFRSKYFDLYKSVRRWHKETGQDKPSETRTLLGRRRIHGDDPKFTDTLNHPIQGSGGDILKIALVLLLQRLKESMKIVLCVHDEIIIEAPEADAEEARQLLEQCMEQAWSSIVKDVPMPVEANICDSWGDKQ